MVETVGPVCNIFNASRVFRSGWSNTYGTKVIYQRRVAKKRVAGYGLPVGWHTNRFRSADACRKGLLKFVARILLLRGRGGFREGNRGSRYVTSREFLPTLLRRHGTRDRDCWHFCGTSWTANQPSRMPSHVLLVFSCGWTGHDGFAKFW